MRHSNRSMGRVVVMVAMVSAAGLHAFASSRADSWPVLTGALEHAAPADSVPASSWPTGEQANFRAEAADRQTHVLSIGPAGLLELRAISGDITVTAGSGRDVSLEVVRRSRGRTDADARQGLADVRAVIEHSGERATITGAYPSGKQPPYWVELSYVVVAPAGTRVSATSVSGDVTLRRITGDISAASTSGDILITDAAQVSVAKSLSGDVSVLNLTSQGQGGVTIMSNSGDVQLDRITAPRVEATSISGSVMATNMSCQRADMKTTSGDISYSGTIARDGRYEFVAHSGDVNISVTGGTGFELQANSLSGTLHAAPDFGLRSLTSSSLSAGGARLSARSLRGTVGDGSAIVIATTFSGDVTIVAR